jgi:hypothetical protein
MHRYACCIVLVSDIGILCLARVGLCRQGTWLQRRRDTGFVHDGLEARKAGRARLV